jgi:general stress protein YciG
MANTRNRGFASMDEQKQREIASKGGKAAHQQGTAHEFSPEEARVAGRKGGEAVSKNRQHMAAIGRLGGEASRGSRRAKNNPNGNDAGDNASQSMGNQPGEGNAMNMSRNGNLNGPEGLANF